LKPRFIIYKKNEVVFINKIPNLVATVEKREKLLSKRLTHEAVDQKVEPISEQHKYVKQITQRLVNIHIRVSIKY
jgi:hypothetical protein